MLSTMAIGLQKVLRPKSKPLDVAAAFASENYDANVAAGLIASGRAMPASELAICSEVA